MAENTMINLKSPDKAICDSILTWWRDLHADDPERVKEVAIGVKELHGRRWTEEHPKEWSWVREHERLRTRG